MLIEIAAAIVVCIMGLVFLSLKPPPPRICGSPGGPPVTSSRFRLRDGRYMAYVLRGLPVEKAKHKILVCHGFRDGKDMVLPFTQELLEQLGACLVIYERPGYGESDPNPSTKRGPKSEAADVEELADHVQLGSRFHIMGISMGTYVVWGCLIYLSHRLSGASFVATYHNHDWSGFPPDLVNMCFKKLTRVNQWVYRISYYAPWFLYWFMTQNLIPSLMADVNANLSLKKMQKCSRKFTKAPTSFLSWRKQSSRVFIIVRIKSCLWQMGT